MERSAGGKAWWKKRVTYVWQHDGSAMCTAILVLIFVIALLFCSEFHKTVANLPPTLAQLKYLDIFFAIPNSAYIIFSNVCIPSEKATWCHFNVYRHVFAGESHVHTA